MVDDKKGISKSANILFWLIGFFIAYFAHYDANKSIQNTIESFPSLKFLLPISALVVLVCYLVLTKYLEPRLDVSGDPIRKILFSFLVFVPITIGAVILTAYIYMLNYPLPYVNIHEFIHDYAIFFGLAVVTQSIGNICVAAIYPQ